MSAASDARAAEFLRIASQFQLGDLVTEASHPVTAELSDVAKRSVVEALQLLFKVDEDVIRKFREFVASGRAFEIADVVFKTLKGGGKLFFTGCGSTGRLSIQLESIWRTFCDRAEPLDDYRDSAISVMAGGDFALVKSVEGFEDYAQFGRKQIADLGVGKGDVTFAITEGGETSFVIGTAWEALERGSKVYFVYNNPDDVLRAKVERSREVIEDPRIEKINLTTGPMAITGSTRMQATTIQQLVILTVLEIAASKFLTEFDVDPSEVPQRNLQNLENLHATLLSGKVLRPLAKAVAIEEQTYRSKQWCNYYADSLGIDVLTDTTERSPTFCTPSFKKRGDDKASDSWAFLYTEGDHETAWPHLLGRAPRCISWTEEEVRAMVEPEKVERTLEILKNITADELNRIEIGIDVCGDRQLFHNDAAVMVAHQQFDTGFKEIGELADDEEDEEDELLSEATKDRIATLRRKGFDEDEIAGILIQEEETYGADYFADDPRGLVRYHLDEAFDELVPATLILVGATQTEGTDEFYEGGEINLLYLPQPAEPGLLEAATRACLKMLLNALSTCIMVRLGRVMGNTMVWVVPSNLKLIDRSTRYVSRLTGLDYESACRLLHEVIEYVQPRMLADTSYPPVVGMSVIRHRHGVSNEVAEKMLYDELR